ncbi:MAG: TonB-dependent receptor [Acidobacteriota bacterium]
MTKRRKIAIVDVVILLFALASVVSAQANGGEIRGRVEAENGQPLAQSTVVLANQRGDLRRETTTDAEGFYRFSRLPSGQYRVEASAQEYRTESKDEVHLTEGAAVEVSFRLQAERRTLREAEERGAVERNPNIFIRRVDLNPLRDPFLRRGIEPVFLSFSALENNYGAEAGAAIRQILFVRPREPRHQIHASIYEAHQNSVFNARPFFNVGPLRPSKRNEFGFSASGPVMKDKLFFTTSLDLVRESGFVNGNVRVPLLTERRPTSDDPATNTIVEALLQAYPPEAPNLPNVAPRQLNSNAVRRIDSVDWNFRMDYLLGAQDRLAFQYTLFDYSEDPFELVIGQNPKTDLRPQTFSATHRHTWSANTIVQSSFHFDRLAALLLPTERFRSLLAPLGLEAVPDIDFGGGLADVTGIGPGNQFPRKRFQNRFSGNVDLSYQRGRHQLRFGGRTTRIQLNDLQSDNSRGSFTFSNNFGRTAVENFLEGTPTTFTITLGDLDRGFRNWEHAFYGQDTYQIKPGLTLTLGLRYEVITVPSEVNDRTEFSFDTDANNVAPQVAFAWAPGEGATVVRGGYGISFAHIFPGTYQTARFNPPAVRTISVPNPTSLTNPLKDVPMTPGEERSELNLLSPDLVSPYSHQYNLTIQRRLSKNLLFQIGYIGHRTQKPFFQVLSNRAEPLPGIESTIDNIDQRRPDPRFLRIQTIINGGIFYYDALKLGLTQSLAKGLALDIDYIFSKALSSSTSDFLTTLNKEQGPGVSQNNEDFFADLKAPSIFDHRHILIVHYSYEFPFRFPNRSLAVLLKGWTISGMTEWRTGRWFGIETSSDAPGFGNVDGEGGDRPNVTNPSILGKAIDNPDTSTSILKPEFFNTDIPPGGRGNEPVRAFRADPVSNTNLALTKSFTFSQREQALQFRVEFLNLFNHPLFARPGDVFPADIFGKIVDTQNKGRVIQFILRLNF